MPPATQSWPLPPALTIDQCLHDLTDHLGIAIDEDFLDVATAIRPDLVVAWVSAASRYAAADFVLRMLNRPIACMRDEVAPDTGLGDDEITEYATNLHHLLNERGRQIAERDAAHLEFKRACQLLQTFGLLCASPVQWQEVDLVVAGLTASVHIPADATSPWTVVKANEKLLNKLADANLEPAAGQPVVRRQSHGFVRLDEHGNQRRLLPDPAGDYWLHDFAWTQQ